jgi:hypothetical protein
MPERDPINPKANAWLNPSDKGRPNVTGLAGLGASASPTGRRGLSATVVRLAKRLGKSPEELTDNIPADTLRRLKYPVLEIVNPDGTRTFKRDLGVSEGLISSPRK